MGNEEDTNRKILRLEAKNDCHAFDKNSKFDTAVPLNSLFLQISLILFLMNLAVHLHSWIIGADQILQSSPPPRKKKGKFTCK
jgi:hypothetical protein